MVRIRVLIRQLVVLVILIGLTFHFLLKEVDRQVLYQSLGDARIGYLILGFFIMFGFVLCEALNLKRLLKLYGHVLTLKQTLTYAFTGFFFCAVTPSATGGQPMQVYLMKRDQIEFYQSSIVLLFQLACFQLATVTIASVALLSQYEMVAAGKVMDITLIIVGFVSNLSVLLFVSLAITSKRMRKCLEWIIVKAISCIPFLKQKQKLIQTVMLQFQAYANGHELLKCHKKTCLNVLALTFVQVLGQYFVSYLVCMSLGLSSVSSLVVIALQSLVNTAVSSLPLPGGVGANERIFLFLFSGIYPIHQLMSGLLLTRTITFYGFVLISGLMMMVLWRHSAPKIKKPTRNW